MSGSGFQSIQGGFGGIYVLFGWVQDGAWQPSQGGLTGETYLYVPDSETKDNQGYQRFVTFPGSSTAEAANGGEISPEGNWSLEMIVPGPTFQARDRDGNVQSVDCREVRCGVITVGAHGVANANNESFTPVTFVSGSGQAAPVDAPAEPVDQAPGQDQAEQAPAADDAAADQSSADQEEAGASADGPAPEGTAAPAAVAGGPATVGVDQSTIIAGRVLSFSAQGFAPGEQVMISLGAGLAGAGPISAGQFGEVAGAITLPSEMRAGTHVLKVTGAGSGQTTEVSVSVMADPATLSTVADDEPATGWTWAFVAAVVTGGLLLLLFLSSLVTAIVQRRRAKAAERAAEQTEQSGAAETAQGEPGTSGASDGTGSRPPGGGEAAGTESEREATGQDTPRLSAYERDGDLLDDLTDVVQHRTSTGVQTR